MPGDVTTFETGFATPAWQRPSRMDVIPAGPARRQWSADGKARIVAASFEPGANIAQIARTNELLPQQLYAWRHDSMSSHASSCAPIPIRSKICFPTTGSTAAYFAAWSSIRLPDTHRSGCLSAYDRLAVDAKIRRSPAAAHAVDHHRAATLLIKLHSLHPPPPRKHRGLSGLAPF